MKVRKKIMKHFYLRPKGLFSNRLANDQLTIEQYPSLLDYLFGGFVKEFFTQFYTLRF